MGMVWIGIVISMTHDSKSDRMSEVNPHAILMIYIFHVPQAH